MGIWPWFAKGVLASGKKTQQKALRQRKFQLERLESRSLMCADLADLMPAMSGAIHFTDEPAAEHVANPALADLVNQVSAGMASHANTQGLENYLSKKPTSSGSNGLGRTSGDPSVPVSSAEISAYLPADVGVFNQQAISFTTASNGMPILNSLPSSPTSIFLDFDGDTTTGTLAYDEDGNATTFNTTEQNNIANAWKQVSQYFAMFDTNVTTIEPTTPKAWNAIGNNIVGGYSYVGVFPNTYPRSFNNSGDARTRVSGLVHELGHNFGLSHQADFDLLGNKTAEYSSGFDSLHGPLMGVDYAQSVHKWFIGHASGSASTLQDDMQVIANRIKAYQPVGSDGYKADDYGNTLTTATNLTAKNELWVASGTLERMNDVDAFQFASLGGNYTVSALPDGVSGVDLKLEIYDASGNLVAAKDSSTNYQVISLPLASGTYYAMLSSHGNYGDVGAYNVVVSALPTQWTAQDVGTVGLPGSSTYNNTTGVYSIEGSGTDIWGTSDGMQFAWQTLTGDGSIIAKVESMTGTASWAKSGLEIRETTASNSKHIAMVQTWANGPQMITRSTTGGSSTSVNSTAQAFAPKWLKLTRVGNVFTGSTSSDGVTWTQFGTSTVTMGSQVKIGLVSSALSNSKLNLATFSNVALTGTLGITPPVYNSLTPPANVTVSADTGTGFNIAWNDGAGETGYRIERADDGVNFTAVGTVGANVTSFSNVNLTGSLRYFYRVVTLDASGGSLPSSVVSGINRPSAVTNFTITSLDNTRTVLNWRDTHGETGYRVERSSDGGATFTTLTTVGTNVPSYTDTGLSTATSYNYRVTPLSSLGDGVAALAVGSTRLPAVSGTAFTTKSSNSLTFSWNDLTNETSYRIQRSTDGTTYSTLTTLAANITSYTDATVTAANEYYYRVIGVNAITESVLPTAIFTATPAATALPAPWSAADIGAVNGTGTTDYTSGTLKVISSGADIWGTADTFRYTYQPLTGDGSITAKVNSAENTGGWAKLGVMVRESLAANSKHAMVVVTPSNGVAMQYRSSTGGSSSHVAGPALAAPYWVRMTRVGNVLTSFSSADGVTWTQVGAVTISMASTVYIGLSANANTTSLLNTSTFTNVTVSNNAPTVVSIASASPSVISGTSTNLSALAADDHGEANVNYSWAISTKPAGAADPALSVNGTNAAKSTVATFTSAGAYTFVVTMIDSGGLSVTSSVNISVQQSLTSISVSPANSTINGGTTLQLNATAYDQFAAAIINPPTFAWSVTGGGAIDSSGLYMASNNNTIATISATSGSVSGNAIVQVLSVNQSPTLVNAPSASPNVISGNSTNLSVLATDDAGEAGIVYTWSSLSKPVGAADPLFALNGTNAAKNSTASFTQAGDYTFSVEMRDTQNASITASVAVSVVQTATSLVVSPANIILSGGAMQSFSASVRDQFGQPLTVQPGISWSLIGSGVVDQNGNYLASESSSTATVTATSGLLSNSTNITVVNQAPTVAVSAASAANPVTGTSTALNVLGADDRGESTLTYSWSVTGVPSGANTPQFSANGTNNAKTTSATFSQAGAYSFLVTITDLGGASTTSSVSVTVNQTVASVLVSPATTTVNVGSTQQFTATAGDQFGKAFNTPPTISWSVFSGGGTISSTGLYTAPSTTGSAIVRASSGGAIASASITIVSSAPATPTGVSATALSRSSIRVNWSSTGLNTTGFYVEYSTNGTSWTRIAVNSATSRSYTVTGLTANTTYQFRVAAFGGSGLTSPFSSIVSAKTKRR
jgi:regulation of enolase protein 1 (concanavalin A-like superfamily)